LIFFSSSSFNLISYSLSTKYLIFIMSLISTLKIRSIITPIEYTSIFPQFSLENSFKGTVKFLYFSSWGLAYKVEEFIIVVSFEESIFLVEPKVPIFNSPCTKIKTFSGFKSKWIIALGFCSWRYCVPKIIQF
jgi:hypothetical protein